MALIPLSPTSHEWEVIRRSPQDWEALARKRGVNKDHFAGALARGKSPMEAAMPVLQASRNLQESHMHYERLNGLCGGTLKRWSDKYPDLYTTLSLKEFAAFVAQNLKKRNRS